MQENQVADEDAILREFTPSPSNHSGTGKTQDHESAGITQ